MNQSKGVFTVFIMIPCAKFLVYKNHAILILLTMHEVVQSEWFFTVYFWKVGVGNFVHWLLSVSCTHWTNPIDYPHHSLSCAKLCKENHATLIDYAPSGVKWMVFKSFRGPFATTHSCN